MRNCPHGISAPAAAGAKSACETVCLCVPAVVRELPPLTTSYVPKDSIVREFVGGSIFKY